jgi:hypothetical protein
MKLLLKLTDREFGWSHSGVESWGANWPSRAETVALEQIRLAICKMVNLGELETFSRTDIDSQLTAEQTEGKDADSIKISYGDKQSNEWKERWVNANNFLVDIANVRATKQWSKGKDHPLRGRSWNASATMLYDLEIYGKE